MAGAQRHPRRQPSRRRVPSGHRGCPRHGSQSALPGDRAQRIPEQHPVPRHQHLQCRPALPAHAHHAVQEPALDLGREPEPRAGRGHGRVGECDPQQAAAACLPGPAGGNPGGGWPESAPHHAGGPGRPRSLHEAGPASGRLLRPGLQGQGDLEHEHGELPVHGRKPGLRDLLPGLRQRSLGLPASGGLPGLRDPRPPVPSGCAAGEVL